MTSNSGITNNSRPESDTLLIEIADYVCDFTIDSQAVAAHLPAEKVAGAMQLFEDQSKLAQTPVDEMMDWFVV